MKNALEQNEQRELLIKSLSDEYFGIRDVNGVLCGLKPYLTTVGVVIALNECTYERRYCFKEFGDAYHALLNMQSADEHLDGPWLKCKGKFQGQPIDIWNPLNEYKG